MMTIDVSRVMAVEADVVWELLANTGRWAEWGPSVTEVDVPDVWLRAHSTGRVRSPLGIWLPFEVTGFEDGRHWSWAVAGVPATTHTVEPVADGCKVTFGVPMLAAPYTLVCRAALRRIERQALAAPTA